MKNKSNIFNLKRSVDFSNYMEIAIETAEKQLLKNRATKYRLKKNKKEIYFENYHQLEIPVGCVIIDNTTKKIISKSCNKTRCKNNPTQHAEIICINQAMKKLNTNRLTNCSMYITLEPCCMCAGAIALSKIGKVYIGCLSKKTGAVISNLHYFMRNICNHKPEIYYPIMEKECRELLRGFFRDI